MKKHVIFFLSFFLFVNFAIAQEITQQNVFLGADDNQAIPFKLNDGNPNLLPGDIKAMSSKEGWTDIATEPSNGRMDGAYAIYNDLIWSITGYNTSNSDVRYYNPETDTWNSVTSSAPSFGSNFAHSGASYLNKAFVYGDAATAGFTGLWSYDMDANVWANETPGGTAPPDGIWAPSWVEDTETGYWYVTGGASVPGVGDLTSVYVYDPINNEWLDPLPNFRTARDFHSAFIFTDPASGHKMLAVVGGYGSVELSNTQCYDFVTETWNAENADIPGLSGIRWGMGYAGNNNQLWIIGGIDATGNPINTSLYYDIAGGVWVDGGIFHATATYRTSAIAFNSEIYKLSGSTGGFTPTGLASKFENPTYTVTFKVDDGADPIDGALIEIDGGTYTTTAGEVAIDLEEGTCTYTVTAEGFDDFTGTYTVTTDAGQTVAVHMTETISVKNLTAAGISVFPNPSDGVFNVNVKNSFNLEVFDITGKVINTQVLTGNSTIEINTAGVYFLRFSDNKTTVVQRVIIK